jgi:hypothetical protein
MRAVTQLKSLATYFVHHVAQRTNKIEASCSLGLSETGARFQRGR